MSEKENPEQPEQPCWSGKPRPIVKYPDFGKIEEMRKQRPSGKLDSLCDFCQVNPATKKMETLDRIKIKVCKECYDKKMKERPE